MFLVFIIKVKKGLPGFGATAAGVRSRSARFGAPARGSEVLPANPGFGGYKYVVHGPRAFPPSFTKHHTYLNGMKGIMIAQAIR